jgi:hypothetical protein
MPPAGRSRVLVLAWVCTLLIAAADAGDAARIERLLPLSDAMVVDKRVIRLSCAPRAATTSEPLNSAQRSGALLGRWHGAHRRGQERKRGGRFAALAGQRRAGRGSRRTLRHALGHRRGPRCGRRCVGGSFELEPRRGRFPSFWSREKIPRWAEARAEEGDDEDGPDARVAGAARGLQ